MHHYLPKAKVTGGPHGKDLKVEIDGEEVHGLSHAELIFDVNDVVRLKMTQFVGATVEVSGVAVTPIVRVRVVEFTGDEGDKTIAESTADTVWEALYDCARQLELAARGVAQAGTMGESSGRPPGH